MPNHPSRYDNTRLHVEYVPLASLRATFAKTKKHNARQLKKLADGMNRTGFNVPFWSTTISTSSRVTREPRRPS